MPRKHFVQDLEAACNPGPAGHLPEGISNVRRGDDDGLFTFVYHPHNGGNDFKVEALIPELSDYPRRHMLIIYASSSTKVPDAATAALDKMADSKPMTVSEIIHAASTTLKKALSADASHDQGSDDEYELDEEADDGWPEEDDPPLNIGGGSQIEDDTVVSSATRRLLTSSLRRDLRQAKTAGFKVGVMGDAKNGMDLYISLGIRITKLELSNEALTAWKLDASKHLILLIQYVGHYKDFADITTKNSGYSTVKSVKMCVGTAAYYKPTISEARAAFTTTNTNMQGTHVIGGANGLESVNETSGRWEGFEGIFISGPLNELLNTRLLRLVQIRSKHGFSWDAAERYYNDYQGSVGSDRSEDKNLEKYRHEPRPTCSEAQSAPIACADALQASNLTAVSFPLLAVQYTLRHLVRCTEFCLVCHNKVSAEFEALKPYVCSSPLCLYQYMSLGFGPSIEYEIVSQPSVVDLLISFCYSAAKGNKLEHFPDGLDLKISSPKSISYKARYDRIKRTLIFLVGAGRPPLKVGDWIVMSTDGFASELWHSRVEEVQYFPTIKLGTAVGARPADKRPFTPTQPSIQPPNRTPNLTPPQISTQRESSEEDIVPGFLEITDVSFRIYDQGFDALSPTEKQGSLVTLMDSLPKVTEMRDWLQNNTKVGQEASLKTFEKISPAALSLLRWIIASNRSCIIPVDDEYDEDPQDAGQVSGKPGSEQRVWGMPNMMQFRFAMGAPDKEQRFVAAVKEKQKARNLRHPTLFAFHGSPLVNWHSIIREGLHFKVTSHGRAYGHGCYHSLDLNTSLNYSNLCGSRSYGQANIWPHSALRVSSAISLNEIVNAPDEFVSRSPHLVVSQLDWIQTRYLFVQREPAKVEPPYGGVPSVSVQKQDKKPNPHHPQDPRYTPTNSERQPLVIPASASRSLAQKKPATPELSATFSSGPKNKRQKLMSIMKESGTTADPSYMDDDDDVIMRDAGPNEDDSSSIATDVEDNCFLISEDEAESWPPARVPILSQQQKGKGKEVTKKPRRDAFIPGLLDTSQITFMPPPSYATSMATKRLSADLQSLIKLQETTPLEELGFYINPELVENVYQWIVELHSFPEHLPIVKDMRTCSPPLTSVVLELRFGPQYPMSPPFVRVVTPRFLSFMQGGGGHVTIGGALCMELLTNDGWSVVSTIESVLMQVRMAITEEKPAAQLEKGPPRQYGIGEAKEAYLRACRTHGWTVPDDFKTMMS